MRLRCRPRRPPIELITLDITIPAYREAVALALYRAGYTVRQRKRKDGNKTVIYIEYRRESN